MLEHFHDVRFPVDVAFGASGGPERRTEIIALASGHERRNQRWRRSRRRYDAGRGIRSLDELYAVVAFFEARRGPFHAFRYRDPVDHSSAPPDRAPSALDQSLGRGDGVRTRFALVKRYGDETRTITHPQDGSVLVALDGVASGAFTFSNGEIVFDAAPAEGAHVTAGFLFDVPVRFASDELSVSVTAFAAGELPAVPLVEVLA